MFNFFIILLAKYLVFFILVIGIIFLFLLPRQKQKRILIMSLFSLSLSYLLAQIAGKIYYNPRPFVIHHFKPLIIHAATNGFPSDHALLSFTIAGIIFLFNKRWGIVLFLSGLLISVARIYAGIHSPIDIVGSFVISVISVAVVSLVLKKLFRSGNMLE